ncbi:MAG: metal ABC transporter permease [Candidatus Omnitrophota bacterium]
MNMVIDFLYKIMELVLPFDWMKYDFMKNALIAVLLVTPVFAVIGTMVISKHMAFFSDVLGHSALTGIAIGMILGFKDPTLPMVVLAVFIAIAVTVFRAATNAASDTVLGVFFAMVVALGIVLLSRGGGFSRYTAYLIGDILSVTPAQILALAVIFIAVVMYWIKLGNRLMLVSVNSSLAMSRGIGVLLIEISFSAVVALVVILSIRLVGILIINSLLILPAAAARNVSRSVRSYTIWAIAISLLSGAAGLGASYRWGTASGATIVLFAAAAYCLTAVFRVIRMRLNFLYK